MFELRERETGIVITKVKSMEEGMNLMAVYEEEDKRLNFYTPDFYELVDVGISREEVEARIYEKMQEIVAIAKEYDEDIDVLNLAYVHNKETKLETIDFFNKHWEREKKIDFFSDLSKKGGESE